MSDYLTLVTALIPLHSRADNGSGPPPRLTGHQADRLAGMAKRDDATTATRPRRRPFGRRPSFA
ncbi:hypothetical protein ACFWA9_11425 [Kitasatospora sp. NPDC059973]|uniref:hypothetical protein n=1 Tax=unclassified Kitasatospora TaxID=2633591 RepID=UPI00331CAD3A